MASFTWDGEPASAAADANSPSRAVRAAAGRRRRDGHSGGHRCGDQITVLVSHRLTSVVERDTIHVFERGRIIESGSHQDLMQLGGEYAEMFTLQAAGHLSATAPTAEPT
ncbi:hypothetical protein [Streptomyces sp. HUAS TT7]|uniref:hypothetical protein n=1 Tax=Streptomyces sp. HUAS TT7 TaxID=3447507 RepID=UPI003F65E4CD